MITHADIEYSTKFREITALNGDKQEVLAEEMPFSQQKISDLLNGKAHWDYETIKIVCDYYHIPLKQFQSLEYTPVLRAFYKTLTGRPHAHSKETAGKINGLKIKLQFLKRERKLLQFECMNLKWEIQKYLEATERTASEIKEQIYVMV